MQRFGGRVSRSNLTLISIVRVAPRATLVLLLASACGKRGDPPAFPPAEVAVVTVRPATVPETFEFPGQVEPYRRVEVRSRVEGIIEERPFTEGAVVRPGELLYRLDQVRYEAAFRSAQARFQNAQQTLERLEPLLAQHAVAQQDVDNARAEFEAAQAALDEAKKDLDDTDVRAEIEGRVGRTQHGGRRARHRPRRPADDHRPARPGVRHLPALVAAAARQWREDPAAGAHSSSREAGWWSQVVLPDGTVLPRTGRLDFVAPSLDAATGTQEFRAVFENARPDARARAVRARAARRLRARGRARRSRSGRCRRRWGASSCTWWAPATRSQTRDVQAGPWTGDRWIIDEGLSRRPRDRGRHPEGRARPAGEAGAARRQRGGRRRARGAPR